MEVIPLHPLFAAEIVGADLTRPPDENLIGAVEDAMARYAVAVIRDADISDAEHIRFSRAFGPLELPHRPRNLAPGAARRRMAPELFDASNLDDDGEIIPYQSERRKLAKGAERFHTDSSFHALPTKWSLLLGHVTPPPSVGGDTRFIDARAVYDALPEAMKERIAPLSAVHDFWKGRQIAGLKKVTEEDRKALPFPPVEHPLVRVMPYGRKALYIGGHASHVVGMPEDEGHRLIEELYDFATQERFIYRHHWRPHDLVIWDNRCTLHAATPLETDAYKRDVRRTTINEYGPEISAVDALAA